MTVFELFVYGALLAAVLVVGVIVSVVVRRQRRLRQADHQPDDAQCWLCGHSELVPVARDTYRCLACGGVQGQQAAALEAAARRARFARLSAGERYKHANVLLREAGLDLIAVDAELEQVLQLSVADVRDLNSDGGAEKLSRFGNALLAVGGLEQKLVDAAVVLASDEQLQRLEMDLGSMNQLLDKLELGVHVKAPGLHMTFGLSAAADRECHEQIQRAAQHMPELHQLHRRLQQQFSALALPQVAPLVQPALQGS
jgi:hypothetical protein